MPETYSTICIDIEAFEHEPVAFVIDIVTADELPCVGTFSSVRGPRFACVAVTVISTVPGRSF